jgi:hypothetical protein
MHGDNDLLGRDVTGEETKHAVAVPDELAAFHNPVGP